MTARRRLAPDDRRAAILAAAGEAFSRRPYADVSMTGIADAAGVSAPLVVFYFGSKRALYLEVLRTAVTSIGDGLRAVPGPPSLDRLHASVRFYAEYARSHRAGFLSYLRGGSETALPEATALVAELRGELAATIAADVVAGLAPRTLDAAGLAALDVAVHGHFGQVDAAVQRWLALPDDRRELVDADTLARLAVAAFAGTLRALLPPG